MKDAFTARLATLSPQQLQLLALELRARLDTLQDERRAPLAIVGMGCRVPGADGPEAFWDLLREGRDVIREVPADRWPADAYFDPDPDARGTMTTRWGGFLDRIDAFDPEFFNLSPREAVSIDPQHRLLLEVAWEALEHAGLAPDRLRGSRTGVFVGVCGGDYFERCLSRGFERIDTYLATGTAHSVASGRLAYTLGLEGPAVSIDTACSSSLTAVHYAARSLRSGECRVAIAAGVNAILWPVTSIALSRGRMMAADGRCKSFDARGDGFVRGEGCGVIVLKRLSDARADGDRVLAIVRGSAVNQDGRSNGLTAPNGRAQTAVIADALADAGVPPALVSYVEAHGTGTPLGDPIELHALGAALSPGRDPRDRVHVGSVKTNIGHLEGAAGIAGVIKTVLMLQAGRIAPSLHFSTPNPFIDWAHLPVEVPTSLLAWEPREGRRIAGVSSFGFSGSNAHVVLEEAPAPAAADAAAGRAVQLCLVSARTAPALAAAADRLERALADPRLSVGDACGTSAVGRTHFEHRAAVLARGRDELRAQLRALADGRADATLLQGQLASTDAPRVAFLFTGQGAQYPGMGAELVRAEPVFRRALERCAAVLDPLLRWPLIETMQAAAAGDRRIHDTPFTQPATMALQFALAELWRSWGVVPSAVMGHSLGEYAAACVAGVMPIEDGLRLVAERARLMSSAAGGGAMLSVFAPGDVVRGFLVSAPSVAVAADNGPDNTVLSGPRADVARVEAALVGAGIEVRPLEIALAAHSAMVEPVLDAFARAAERVRFAAPTLPLISNLTGAIADASIAQASYWRRHLREPVRFGDGMAQLAALGTRLFVEIGPHPSLISMARRYTTGAALQWLASMRRDRDAVEQMTETLGALHVAGVPVDWAGYHRGRGARPVALPTYPFQRESYWIEGQLARPATTRLATTGDDGRAASTAADPRAWLYKPVWAAAPGRMPAAGVAGERWLLVGGAAGLRGAIARAASRAGVQVETIVCDDEMTGDRSDAALVDALNAARTRVPSRILHLEGTRPAPMAADVEALTAATERIGRSALTLVREVASREWPARVWFVTAGATAAGGADNVAAGLLWGFGRTVANEHPEVWGACIEIDRGSDDVRSVALIDEIAAGGGQPDVALTARGRQVARLERLEVETSATPYPATPHLRPDATYVVTGALGGVGRHLVAWLADRGARHLALIARRDPAASDLATFERLRSAGTDVRVFRADVARESDVAAALARIRAEWPRIAGVFHAAGVLDDAVIQRMDWARFARALAPKVAGAWNLHRHTRTDPLDHFVLFASAAGLLGPVGLSNHAAANAALDTLAHLRHAAGLPAVSIDWGWWADTGAVEDLSARQLGTWADGGSRSMRPEEALAVMGHLMASADAQAVVLPLDWTVFGATRMGQAPLFSAFSSRSSARPPMPAMTEAPVAPSVAPDALRSLDASERLARVVAFLRQEIAREVGIPTDRLPLEKPLNALGLDSLMAVQLRNRVQEAAHIAIPVSRFIDGPSVRQLAAELVDRLQEALPAAGAVAPETTGQPDVAGLSDDEVERMLAALLEEKGAAG